MELVMAQDLIHTAQASTHLARQKKTKKVGKMYQ